MITDLKLLLLSPPMKLNIGDLGQKVHREQDRPREVTINKSPPWYYYKRHTEREGGRTDRKCDSRTEKEVT